MLTERHSNMQLLIRQLEKKEKSPGLMFRLGDQTYVAVDTISTGSLGLDIATGIGGIPRGRVTEIFGPPSAGKTTLALQVIASAQKQGLICTYVDMENAFDCEYAFALGVQNDLYVSQVDSGSQCMRAISHMARQGAADLIVVDSVAAMTTEAELKGEVTDSQVGQLARLLSGSLKILIPFLRKNNVALVMINQMRNKIVPYGNPETTPGGYALMHYTSMRIDLRRQLSKDIKDGDERIGNQVTAKVVKNKLAPPFKSAEFDILYGQGVDQLGEVTTLGVKYGVLQKSGSWYFYRGEKIGQGEVAMKEWLGTGETRLDEVKKEITDLAFSRRTALEEVILDPAPENEEA